MLVDVDNGTLFLMLPRVPVDINEAHREKLASNAVIPEIGAECSECFGYNPLAGMQTGMLVFTSNSTFVRLSKLFNIFDSLCMKTEINTIARLYTCLKQLTGTQDFKTNDSGKNVRMKKTMEDMRPVHRRR